MLTTYTPDSHMPELARAVVTWMDYQVICGREMLMSESYVAHPVGEYLRYHHNGEVLAEYEHPWIKSPGRGRPRQLDYVVLTKNKGKIDVVIEAKWIRNNGKLNPQAAIDDILRLEALRQGRGYFLVPGQETHFGGGSTGSRSMPRGRGNGSSPKFFRWKPRRRSPA